MVPGSDEKFGPPQARDEDWRVTRVSRILRGIEKEDMTFIGAYGLLPGKVVVNGEGSVVPLVEIPGYKMRHALYMKNQRSRLDVELIGVSFRITARGRWEHIGKKSWQIKGGTMRQLQDGQFHCGIMVMESQIGFGTLGYRGAGDCRSAC